MELAGARSEWRETSVEKSTSGVNDGRDRAEGREADVLSEDGGGDSGGDGLFDPIARGALVVGESPEGIARGGFGGEDLIDGGAGPVASGDR